MANVAKMAHNLSSPGFATPNAKSPPSTSCSLFMGSNNLNNSPKTSWVFGKKSVLTVKKTSQLGVVASTATTEKLSTVPEIVLQPIKEISGTVKLPGSKSLSIKILLLTALSEGTTIVDNLLSSDNIHYMLGSLRTLGLLVEEDKANQCLVVGGSSGLFPTSKEATNEIQLFLGNAGTTMRPLTAAVVAAGGKARH